MTKNLIAALLVLLSPFAWSQQSTGSEPAKQWLTIIDTGAYAESWQKAGSLFKTQLSQQRWVETLQGIRAPLGEVISRSEFSAGNFSSLPGAPDGEYVVLQYQTRFQNKAASTEILTLSKKSGQWLTVGYFIK
ncbi:DUF4019 domain-containing protein [Shewanella surugensis]|uniref:DUF4019 domain-containing protein n=1 Tax=Shewanella surugensis TaxID=212020 RepID=A0ABT0LBG2_9GAMM|nr:DUF4019 domain-containing protein [Shewanella surugensis]MCL1125044.1 DUF4019 domain-containing protein [Shewanella surugensis]